LSFSLRRRYTHTNAGTYNGDAWSFSGGTYNANGTVDDAISKAKPPS
jgi:hypothetical protein